MKKYYWVLILGIIIIVGGTLLYISLKSPNVNQANTNAVSNQNITLNQNQDLTNKVSNTNITGSIESGITLDYPKTDDIVASPLAISGQAKGTWFFEGEFPIKLLDENGNQIAYGNAIAEGEWMTEDYVTFKANLEFSQGDSKKGTLVLAKNNPSGLPENDLEVKIPVKFQISETQVVKVFFGNTSKDPNSENCQETYPVERTIPKTITPASASLGELIKGPSDQEKTQGYFSSINFGVEVKKLEIINGTAIVDFNEALEQGGGSCKMAAVRSQITNTLKQFSTVQDVVISINGKTEDILQP